MSSYTTETDASQPGVLKIRFSGVFDETVDLESLIKDRSFKTLVFHFKHLKRINSSGVRKWLLFLQTHKGAFAIELEHCPPPVVEQMNLIDGFLAGITVRSIYLPYLCNTCSHEEMVLVEAREFEKLKTELPVVPCPKCKAPEMEFDYLEEEYLHFLSTLTMSPKLATHSTHSPRK
jgi:DNA-directed RNA polymerase subunit RPC12/RpoP